MRNLRLWSLSGTRQELESVEEPMRWVTARMRIVLGSRHCLMARPKLWPQPNITSASANDDRRADSVTPILKRTPSGQYREIEASSGKGTVIINTSLEKAVRIRLTYGASCDSYYYTTIRAHAGTSHIISTIRSDTGRVLIPERSHH